MASNCILEVCTPTPTKLVADLKHKNKKQKLISIKLFFGFCCNYLKILLVKKKRPTMYQYIVIYGNAHIYIYIYMYVMIIIMLRKYVKCKINVKNTLEMHYNIYIYMFNYTRQKKLGFRKKQV